VKQIPLLIISDSPDLRTGLSRISRDLACLASSMPEYRVGILGRGGIGSRQIPVAQYCYDVKHGFGDESLIQKVWSDFADDGEGTIMGIWDSSRLGWLSQGEWIQKRRNKVKLAIYAPCDSAGPHGRLTASEHNILAGFNEVLAYGPFGTEVLSATLGREIDWIPHGIQTDVFQPRDKRAARIAMGVSERQKLVGCVMTNQIRKDWGLWAQCMAMLPDWHSWVHIDTTQRHWDLGELISSFGLADRVTVTFSGSKDDVEMSYLYSACDVTILPSSEGFGFPIAESLACGVPVVHSTYGGGYWGGTEGVLNAAGVLSIQPIHMRMEGIYNTMRPVFDPSHWAEAIDRWPGVLTQEQCRASVAHLDWKSLWPGVWKKWFLRLTNG
jgi:glycosyltransferase involved in cell wall biosynthesis